MRRLPPWRRGTRRIVVVAVALLVAADLLAGFRHISPWLALIASVAVVVLAAALAGWLRLRRKAQRKARHGARRWLVLVYVVCAFVVVAVAVVLAAAVVAWQARSPALAGERQATAALAAARAGHLAEATGDFRSARADFTRASSELHSPLTWPALVLPVISTNLRAARTLADVGSRLAGVGAQVAISSDRFRYHVRGGAVPVAELAATAPQFSSALATVAQVDAQLRRVSGGFLIPQLRSAVDHLRRELVPATSALRRAQGIAANVPDMLGLHGPRTYFLAFQDNAESRATGGLIGLYGLLVADQGHLTLKQVGGIGPLNQNGPAHKVLHMPADYMARYGGFDPASNWQNVNLSPSFPTVASAIEQLAPQSGLPAVNGVVAMDPLGLADLLKLTGPVTIPDWPVPLSAANVAAVTLYDSYVTYPVGTLRQAMLEQLVHAVFSKVSHLTLSDPAALINDLLPAVRGRHLMVASTTPSEETYLHQVGMAGAIAPVRSDALQVTTQNASANKIDWFLHRDVTYDVHLTPNAQATSAALNATVSVALDNEAPTSGQPAEIIGPSEPGFSAGENRTWLTLYTPWAFTSATVDGKSLPLEQQRELGRYADSTFLDLSPGVTTVTVHLAGTVRLLPGGRYQLQLPTQPNVHPGALHVTVSVPAGWRIGTSSAAAQVVHRQLSGASDHTVTLLVRRGA